MSCNMIIVDKALFYELTFDFLLLLGRLEKDEKSMIDFEYDKKK